MNTSLIPIVLCAGFGTRLKPITDSIPKVICPIIDMPLAFFSIKKFFDEGFETVYCNTFYKAEMVTNELEACAIYFGYDPKRIVCVREQDILGSGGGIINVYHTLCAQDSKFNEKDIIVVSGDIASDFPLTQMLDAWKNREQNEMAIMLSLELNEDRDDFLCVSQDGNEVVGFGKSFVENNPNLQFQKRMFSNHQIISSKMIRDQIVKFGSSVDFIYKKILKEKHNKISHLNYPDDAYWFNVGDIYEYQKCLKFFCKQRNLAYPPKNKLHYQFENVQNDFFL